ncbi:MAG TPA: hypothetical protein VLB76_20640 [Thermoanaerobaculia bacterium]|jgi:hypothetical protein|nr:hypothetical protein [Thermoanaerobaculia bacterium]
MTDTIWVVGGEQRVLFYKPEEWAQYRKALVLRVDEGGRVERALEYESPPEHCPEGIPSHVFKSATFQGDTAYLCTQTEVLICDLPSFAIRRVISLPCFNDLHHVTPAPDGRLYVAVTGLDAVAELSPEGELLNLVSVLGGSPWDRFSPDVDYRKVPTTKPHQAHPNFVFFLDDHPWVTRFNQRDAIPLDGILNGRPPFDVGKDEGIHDGHLEGDDLYFTSVKGCVIRFNLRTGRKTLSDLNSLSEPDEDRPLGWCRGILPQEEGTWIGFSRLRYTTLRRNLSWIRHGFRETEHHRERPTRIALYDLERLALIRQIDLEGAGMGAVFSIHQA